MKRIRIIPTLLIKDQGLVKTTKFKKPFYVGDPINTLKIFNEKEVDELALLDISEQRAKAPLDIGFIQEIVSEAFMPIAFGGGIQSMTRIESLLKTGVEKVVLNSALDGGGDLIQEASAQFGVQSIVASLDVKKGLFGKYGLYVGGGKRRLKGSLLEWALKLEDQGVGEILLNSIDRECTYAGFDLELIELISEAVDIPVIASGGAGELNDFRKARLVGASAAAAGAMFVFQRPNQAVLITYPSQKALKEDVFNN